MPARRPGRSDPSDRADNTTMNLRAQSVVRSAAHPHRTGRQAMSRRLNVGEHGVITHSQTGNGHWVARASHRDVDGVVRSRQATGATKTAATSALKDLLTHPPVGVGEYLSGDSTIEQVATAWLEELRIRDEVGTETYDYYRRGIRTLIVPEIGGHRVSELRPVTIKQFYNNILNTTGPDGQPMRTPSRPVWAHRVLSLMLCYAVEIGAIDHNPVHDIQPPRRNKTETRVLGLELFHEVREAVDAYDQRVEQGPRRSHRLLDVFTILAATGVRVSECLALRWCDVFLETTPATVTISGTLHPPRDGRPLRRKEGTKTAAGMRTIAIPPFAVATLRRLQDHAATDDPNQPVFTTRNGTWVSPANIRREWRECRSGRDWDWVTPQTFRKTVATFIDDHYAHPDIGGTEGAGAPIAAAVLGHSRDSVTRTFYIKKLRRAPDVSAIIQDALGLPRDDQGS